MFMEAVEKSGINGLIAGVATATYFGTDPSVPPIFGTSRMPLYVLTGLVGAFGSLIGDGTHLLMKETIPVSKKFNDRASVITGLVVNGILFGGSLYVYQPEVLNDFGLFKAFALGATAEVGGSALYTYLKENQYI